MRIWRISKDEWNAVDNVGDVQRLSQIGFLGKRFILEIYKHLFKKKLFSLRSLFYSITNIELHKGCP